jgi:DNA replication initiation complex subunit (GINS family)
MDSDKKLTYELLFDMLRNEKNREELQTIDQGFFGDLTDYIQDKERLIRDNSDSQLFSGLEREKTLKQLDNAKRLVKELYERREKKLLNLAMISSRTGGILDKSSMLPEENKLFDALSTLLEGFRNDVLYRIMAGNLPELRDARLGQKPAAVSGSAAAGKATAAIAGTAGSTGQNPAVLGTPDKSVASTQGSSQDTLLVRFVHAVPKFLGKELEVYGPFEADDIANLPKQIANILVLKGRAELMKG